jgi:GDP-L-fucose synthase
MGPLAFDRSKPDGTPRKLMDAPKLTALGWSPKIFLAEGLEQTYRWFLQHHAAVRGIPA